MAKKSKPLVYKWEQDIAPYLDDIEAAEGGFTLARRGIVQLEDGRKVFVKIATDDNTKKWIKKEIKVYRILNCQGYEYIPKLLSVNEDNSAMAIEYLEGASFENDWSKPKLEAVIKARKELTKYKKFFQDDPDFCIQDVIESDVGQSYLTAPENIEKLNAKLKALGLKLKFSKKQVEGLKEYNKGWSLKENTLIHEDIRADNFGYFAVKQKGKLIDWNWLCIGDESLDTTPLFVNMYLAGFNPYEYHPEKYDRHMLIYLTLFWMTSLLEGDQDSSDNEWKRRLHQAKSLEVCIKLLDTIF